MSEQIIAGRYRVLKHKGNNGLCSAYFVEDSLNGDRLVVKILPDTDPQVLEYIKAANLLRDSEPSGIVLASDGGLLDEPAGFYMAYPLLPGYSLDDYLKIVGDIALPELKGIISSLVDALGELHERGYVHLFLSPRNVLYAPGADVHIKDPALSCAFFNPLLERLTSFDYSFFSPELMDAPDDAGVAADIFALGRIIEGALARVSSDRLAGAARAQYESLRQIAHRCLESEAGSRFADVGAIRQALEKVDAAPISGSEPLAASLRIDEDLPSIEDVLDADFFGPDAHFDLELADGWRSDNRLLPQRHRERVFRRQSGSPWLKLLLLGAALAAAICVLVLGRGLPGKSAKTLENLGDGAETTELSEAEEREPSPESNADPASEAEQPVLLTSQDLGATATPVEQSNPNLLQAGDAPAPDSPSPGPAESANQAPVAGFTLSPASGSSPLQVWLDGSGSYDPEGDALSYAWSFGGAGAALYHVFESNILPCNIPVTLTVTDSRGLSSSTTRSVTLY